MTKIDRIKDKLINLRLKVMAQHLETLVKEANEKTGTSCLSLANLLIWKQSIDGKMLLS